jgi:hypothetical protein
MKFYLDIETSEHIKARISYLENEIRNKTANQCVSEIAKLEVYKDIIKKSTVLPSQSKKEHEIEWYEEQPEFSKYESFILAKYPNGLIITN